MLSFAIRSRDMLEKRSLGKVHLGRDLLAEFGAEREVPRPEQAHSGGVARKGVMREGIHLSSVGITSHYHWTFPERTIVASLVCRQWHHQPMFVNATEVESYLVGYNLPRH